MTDIVHTKSGGDYQERKKVPQPPRQGGPHECSRTIWVRVVNEDRFICDIFSTRGCGGLPGKILPSYKQARRRKDPVDFEILGSLDFEIHSLAKLVANESS